MDFCEWWDLTTHLDEPSDSDDNTAVSSEDDHPKSSSLDAFDEITELSELEKFTMYLKNAQKVALEVERAQGTAWRPYTGQSRTTQFCRKKFRANLASKGFLGVFEIMEQVKSKKELTVGPEEEEESEEGLDSDSGLLQSHSGQDQVQGRIGDYNSPDPGSERSLPSSVACSESCTLIGTIREEEEENSESSESDISSHKTLATEDGPTMDNPPGIKLGNGDDDTDEIGRPSPARAFLEDLRCTLTQDILDTPRC